jgi:hypothetical protein
VLYLEKEDAINVFKFFQEGGCNKCLQIFQEGGCNKCFQMFQERGCNKYLLIFQEGGCNKYLNIFPKGGCNKYLQIFQEGGCNKFRLNSHRQAGPERNQIFLPEEEVPLTPVCSTITARYV